MFISQAIAQTAPAAASAGGDMFSALSSQLPFFALMIAAMYFVIIRPQQKRQKEHRTMIDALAKGDEVVVGGGILGKVTKLGDSYIGVEIAPNTEVQVQRAAVLQVLPKGSIK